MKQPLQTILPPPAHHISISTFHTISLTIFPTHIDTIPINPNFSILHTSHHLSLIKPILKETNIHPKKFH
ncbi:UvrD-helicase domain-containing protein, partial [Bacillus licheniformis]|uniref:UvrD-helicase domain-containing protein n=1 Tax=Bacillus licheniformis TaxID=1402 RepID=UPI003C130291